MISKVKYRQYIVWALFIALFVYLIMRSVLLPILHDEAATFYYYIQTGDFLPPNAHWDANNHVLNSFLSHLSYRILGNEPWILRLPNVLSFILFFWSAWGVSASLKNTAVRWGFFLSLTMAHYLFEFFGQTRGYGISMALLLFAVWMFLRFLNSKKTIVLYGIAMVLFLAVSANLTLLIPSFLFISYSLIVLFSDKGLSRQSIQPALGLIFLVLIVYAPLVWFSFALKKGGALYYGGTSSFWDYTGNSLSLYFTGYYAPWLAVIYTALFLLVVAVFAVLLLKARKIQTIVSQFPSFMFAWLLTGSILSIFALRYLLHVNFPEDRAAVYLYPFLIGSIAFLINDLSTINAKNYSLFIIPLFFFPLHFLFNINTSTTIFPMEENPPKKFFKIVSDKAAFHQHDYPATVGGYHMQRLCWSYLNHQNGGRQNEMLVSNHIDTLCDFQIVDIKRKLPDNFGNLYLPLNEKPDNNLYLYQRKKPLLHRLIFQQDSITNWNHSNNEYFDLASFKIPDSLKGKPLFVGITATIDAHDHPFVSSVVISQKDGSGNELSQESIHLDWLKNKWDNQSNNLKQGMIIPVIDEKSEILVIYIWNLKNNHFLIQKVKVELFVLE